MPNASTTADATLVLKGMLGIGSSTSTGSNKNNKNNKNTTTNTDSPKKKSQQSKGGTGTGNSSSTKKGKKKKNTHDTKGKNSYNGNSNGRQQQQQQQQRKDENYAWSAFQSPPDASTLPLPAFGTNFLFDEEHDIKPLALAEKQSQSNSNSGSRNGSNNHHQGDVVLSSSPSSATGTPTPTRNKEQEKAVSSSGTRKSRGTSTSTRTTCMKGDENSQSKKNQPGKIMISNEKQTENEIKAILNISNNQNDDDNGDSGGISGNVSNEEKVVDRSDATTGTQNKALPIGQHNHSGVNLANLTISTSAENTNTTRSSTEIHQQSNTVNETKKQYTTNTHTDINAPVATPGVKDPLSMLMNAQPYGTANPTFNNNHYQSTYQSHNIYPSHQHSLHYPLHTPPFFTIQVQVPPLLMPGRRMVLPGSPMTGGYPINIVVPDGVAPGMVIPVSIPNPSLRGGVAIPHH